MARTKQTARKSTGGVAPRLWNSLSDNVSLMPPQLQRPFKAVFDPETWIPPLAVWDPDSSLMHRVLSSPELFENILAQVDVRTLLISGQRVARFWHLTITSSPRLQRMLFFKADYRSVNGHNVAKGVANPLLQTAFPAWFPEQKEWISEVEEREQHGTDEEEEDGKSRVLFPTLALYPKQPFAFDREAFEYPNASWKQMLTHNNPPVRSVATWNRTIVWNGSSDRTICTFYHVCGRGLEGQMSGDDEGETHKETRRVALPVINMEQTDGDNFGLRMREYFAFLQNSDARAFTYLHFPWSGAGSAYLTGKNHILRHEKLPDLPDDTEVVQKWEELVGIADVVVSNERTKGWCGTKSGRAQQEVEMRSLGERMVGYEVRKDTVLKGLQPMWQWEIDVAKRD